jgi:hypothetical protein
MTLAIKGWSGVAVLAVFLILANRPQLPLEQIDRGGQWLSWSPKERDAYVDGFVSGYLQGSNSACNVADDLFGTGKTYTLDDGHRPTDMPSARCLARMEKYSKGTFREGQGLDLSAYTGVVTDFYTNHPEYRGIPFFNLIKLLSDGNNKTADQIYQMAKRGELRPLR